MSSSEVGLIGLVGAHDAVAGVVSSSPSATLSSAAWTAEICVSTSMQYQVGSALGLAAMTAPASSQGADRLGDVGALTGGYSAAFLGAAGVALAGGVLATVLLRMPKTVLAPEGAPDESQEPIAA